MSTIPDFSKLDFSAGTSGAQPTLVDGGELWSTPEQIDVRGHYAASDSADLEHLDYMPGIPPFLRGPYSTM